MKATGLAAGHGARVLFSGLDLVLAPGDVVGLVGANGAGKSTLLRLLAGETVPGGGQRRPSARRPPRSGTCRRSPTGGPARPWRRSSPAAPGSRRPRRRWTPPPRRWGPARRARTTPTPSALDRWLALGGADLDERAEAVADDVGLGVALDTPMTALSGGQAARAGLAALLLSRYDVLLLDEPTNDLDLDGLERLERFVAGLRSPAVVVSHDREFLARTVNRIVELDLAQQQVGVYEGGYDSYLAEREIARRHAREAYEEYDDRLGGLKDRASDAAQLDGSGRPQRPAQVDGQRQDRPQQARRDQREAGREGPADAAR